MSRLARSCSLKETYGLHTARCIGVIRPSGAAARTRSGSSESSSGTAISSHRTNAIAASSGRDDQPTTSGSGLQGSPADRGPAQATGKVGVAFGTGSPFL